MSRKGIAPVIGIVIGLAVLIVAMKVSGVGPFSAVGQVSRSVGYSEVVDYQFGTGLCDIPAEFDLAIVGVPSDKSIATSYVEINGGRLGVDSNDIPYTNILGSQNTGQNPRTIGLSPSGFNGCNQRLPTVFHYHVEFSQPEVVQTIIAEPVTTVDTTQTVTQNQIPVNADMTVWSNVTGQATITVSPPSKPQDNTIGLSIAVIILVVGSILIVKRR